MVGTVGALSAGARIQKSSRRLRAHRQRDDFGLAKPVSSFLQLLNNNKSAFSSSSLSTYSRLTAFRQRFRPQQRSGLHVGGMLHTPTILINF